MCGIAGFYNSKGQGLDWQGCLERMKDVLIHRGPDDSGVWMDREAGIGLAHRRLSILDLSPEGHQPMPSASGRFVIVFNGEIYNFEALRAQLPQTNWRGHSDTEVILEAIEHWGLEKAVSRFIGMFAFALWDRKERKLHLVRDRLGIKPLYYGWQGDSFLFASELKAFKEHPDFKNEIDRNALTLFLRNNYLPSPFSIYKGIGKLQPGHILTLDGNRPQAGPKTHAFWSAKEVAEQGAAQPFTGSDEEAIAHLDAILRDAVKLRMIADVPLGAFLSGGIDSSTVVALMQAQSKDPVKTFSIGFHEESHNEAKDAKKVAQHLGTDHTELYVTPEEARNVIPRLPTLYDEPFSDASQIPTFLVSQLAKQKVTVSLSGDGGDELFAGYGRYAVGHRVWEKVRRFPAWSRGIVAHILKSVSPGNWNRLAAPFGSLLPSGIKLENLGHNVHTFSGFLQAGTPKEIYRILMSHYQDPASLVKNSMEPATRHSNGWNTDSVPHFMERMMLLDTVTYLPDDILTKVDRASMGVSLEARVPLLDHRVVETAWRMPLHLKVRDGQSKWLLRQVLYQYVPKQLIERPKRGFGVPVGAWLRGPLREWAEDLLHADRLNAEGFFNPEPIHNIWAQHLANKGDWQYLLWDVLMFQAWLSEQRQPK